MHCKKKSAVEKITLSAVTDSESLRTAMDASAISDQASARTAFRSKNFGGIFVMGRGILLWMLGVPLPIILLLAMCSHN
jgi:hypothetical protein